MHLDDRLAGLPVVDRFWRLKYVHDHLAKLGSLVDGPSHVVLNDADFEQIASNLQRGRHDESKLDLLSGKEVVGKPRSAIGVNRNSARLVEPAIGHFNMVPTLGVGESRPDDVSDVLHAHA